MLWAMPCLPLSLFCLLLAVLSSIPSLVVGEIIPLRSIHRYTHSAVAPLTLPIYHTYGDE